MMITLEAHYIYLLIISNAIMLALACSLFAKFERRCLQIDEFWGSPTGNVLSGDDTDSSSEQMAIAQRLEKRVGELQRTVKVMEIQKTKPEEPPAERSLPIENAVRMAKLGASVDDLTKSCGLNIGEARLMTKLHGQAQFQSNGTH